MSRLSSLIVVIVFANAGPALAADEKPLTPVEAQEGWREGRRRDDRARRERSPRKKGRDLSRFRDEFSGREELCGCHYADRGRVSQGGRDRQSSRVLQKQKDPGQRNGQGSGQRAAQSRSTRPGKSSWRIVLEDSHSRHLSGIRDWREGS